MKIRLEQQFFGYSSADQRVKTIQLWTGFEGCDPRTKKPIKLSAVVMSVNGIPTSPLLLKPRQAISRFHLGATTFTPIAIDEQTARAYLAAIDVEDKTCSCGHLLPIAAPWCTNCGANTGIDAALAKASAR